MVLPIPFSSFLLFVFFCGGVVLGMEPRASIRVGQVFDSELHPTLVHLIFQSFFGTLVKYLWCLVYSARGNFIF